MTASKDSVVSVERVAHSILMLRGQRVLLDSDLAALWRVDQASTNRSSAICSGFPLISCFSSASRRAVFLRSQIATSKSGRGGRRYAPYVFTEHGAIMAAMVLTTDRVRRAGRKTEVADFSALLPRQSHEAGAGASSSMPSTPCLRRSFVPPSVRSTRINSK